MIEVLFVWTTILAAALILGYGTICFVYGKRSKGLLHFDIYVVCGLLILNVYAEAFSIFYKVGVMACFIIMLVCTLILLLLLINKKVKLKKHITYHANSKKIYIGALIVLIMVIWTAQDPMHYDTGLYHAQAIHWIEDYGVVPGLGNLHNRLAYNSAFMPFQALYSLKWHFGRSLHSLNGFLCCFFLIYAILTNQLFGGGL